MLPVKGDWTFISCFSSLSQALLPSDIHWAPSPVYNNCVLIWLPLDLLNNQTVADRKMSSNILVLLLFCDSPERKESLVHPQSPS